MQTPATHLAILGTLLAVAVASDVAQRRIPNLVVAPLAVAGLASQWLTGGPAAALWAGLAGLGVAALLFLPWATGKMGGGDLKLMAAVAAWIDPSQVVTFLLVTAIAGGPLALATWAGHRLEQERALRRIVAGAATLDAVAPAPPTAPLAVAIAVAAFVVRSGGLS